MKEAPIRLRNPVPPKRTESHLPSRSLHSDQATKEHFGDSFQQNLPQQKLNPFISTVKEEFSFSPKCIQNSSGIPQSFGRLAPNENKSFQENGDDKPMKPTGQLSVLQEMIHSLKEELCFARLKQEGIEKYSQDLQNRLMETIKESENQKRSFKLELDDQKEKMEKSFKEIKEALLASLSQKEEEIKKLRADLDYFRVKAREPEVEKQKLALSEQSCQVLASKRTIEELERFKTVCQRKWSAVLEENEINNRKIASLEEQTNQTFVNFKMASDEMSSRLNSVNFEMLKIVQRNAETKEKRAAELLFDQMRALQEQIKGLILENEKLRSINAKNEGEIGELSVRLRAFQKIFNGKKVQEEVIMGFNAEVVVKSLKERVEELLDCIEEMKFYENIREIGTLKGRNEELEMGLEREKQRNEALRERMLE